MDFIRELRIFSKPHFGIGSKKKFHGDIMKPIRVVKSLTFLPPPWSGSGSPRSRTFFSLLDCAILRTDRGNF